MLWNQDDLGITLRYKASAEAAERIGVSVQALGVREPNDFETAFAAMNRDMPDAILMVADALTNSTENACSISPPRIACRRFTRRSSMLAMAG